MIFNVVHEFLQKNYYRYGVLVSKYPLIFILAPLPFLVVTSVGAKNLVINRDIVALFLPASSPFQNEQDVAVNFKGDETDPRFLTTVPPSPIGARRKREARIYTPGQARTAWSLYAIILAKDRSNILKPVYAKEINLFLDYIHHNLSVVTASGKVVPFSAICEEWAGGCFVADHVQLINRMILNPEVTQNLGSFTYPIWNTEIYPGGIYLGTSLGGVIADDAAGHVVSAEAWQIKIDMNIGKVDGHGGPHDWSNAALQKIFDYADETHHIDIYFAHSRTLVDELVKGSKGTMIRFGYSMFLLYMFCTLNCVCFQPQGYVDWLTSKPFAAGLGMLSVIFACATTAGLVGWFDGTVADVVTVMPFLALSIGVDDMFILLAAWQKTANLESVPVRIGTMMSTSAVSITITTLTDALSFGVGTISDLRGVSLFCMYCSLAILFTFVYQMTFFLGFIVLFARLEVQKQHCYMCCEKPYPFDSNQSTLRKLFLTYEPHKSEINHESRKGFSYRFANLLSIPEVKVIVIAMWAIYITTSTYGIFLMEKGLKNSNLISENSYARNFLQYQQVYFDEQGKQLEVIVRNPPEDLYDPIARENISRVVEAFEDSKCSFGSIGTDYWLFHFKAYLDRIRFPMPESKSLFYEWLDYFLRRSSRHASDISWKGVPLKSEIASFRFRIGMKSSTLMERKVFCVANFRYIASNFSEYDIVTFADDYIFADQYEFVPKSVLQNVGIAVAIMIVVSIVLIPEPICTLWIALSVLSILVGVVAFLGYWKVNLDAISMVTILMSIGFSVDYSAHISYGYVTAVETKSEDKIRAALNHLGKPMLQAGLSTLLCMVPLGTIQVYMVSTFFKTVVLVVIFGLWHALFVLPVMLVIFDKRQKYSEDQ